MIGAVLVWVVALAIVVVGFALSLLTAWAVWVFLAASLPFGWAVAVFAVAVARWVSLAVRS